MGYASKLGRARISARNPRAAGQCDRCGLVYNHVNLQWQYDWRGASLQNLRLLVCDTCLDVPQQQLRAIVVPADPVPIQNPRTTDYVNAEQNTRTTQGNTVDPTTGIPVIGGDTRGSMVVVPASGDLLLEGGAEYLLQENNYDKIALEEDLANAVEFDRVTQQTGEPPLGRNERPGTDPNAPGDDDPGLPYNNINVPETGPL